MAAGTGVYIADGRLLSLNSYDNELYCYGKGPSGTTVSAPQLDPTLGSSVTITGTVTDQSPSGRLNANYGLDFSLKGTPAISDESMQAWMEYKFMQQAMPTDATGVPVSLDAIDPNGNYIHIGTVTSDITGTYGCDWTPEVPGTYQIFANFAGSNSYGPSASSTYLTMGQAPQTTNAPTPAPQTVADIYLIPGIIGIILTIIIVGAVIAVLSLRTHP